MAYTGIDKYVKPHGSGKNGSGTIIINKTGKQNGFNPQNCNVVNSSAHNATIDNLKATNANIDNAEFVYIMSPNGIINKLYGDEIEYKNGRIDYLDSSEIVTNKLKVNEDANIKNLIADYIQSTNITTDYLTVNQSAHFFELIIDKIRSVQGTQMNTAANCIADYVEAYDSNNDLVDLDSNSVAYYRIYWKNTDADGRNITNDWLVNDQAICESFNVRTGVSYDVSNKYYWRLVEATDGGTPKYINFATNEVSATRPSDFEICFTNGFNYGDEVDQTDNFYDFNVTSQIIGQWDDNTYIFSPTSTLYGIQLTINGDSQLLYGGKLIFNTDIPTKLNVGIYYDDGTFNYFPANDYTTDYALNIDSTYEIEDMEGNPQTVYRTIEAIVINTAVIDKWDACNWIDLSNTIKDATVSGKSAIPSIGDNICQLGYRYGANPSQDDVARASAIIIAAYNTPDSGVKPPSYAQYQNITDFSLTTHRGSYFDATGAYFVGNLAAGTTVAPGVSIPVVIDSWRLLSDYSIITKDTYGTIVPSTITLSLLHNNGTTTSTITTLPADKAIYVNGTLNSGGLTINVSSFNSLNITLRDSSNTQTFDKLIIETFDINAANGKNGSFYQFIYTNDYTTPETPTSTSFPPSGWTTAPTTPDPDEFTYMSQRQATYDASNNISYSAWTTPVRITGLNGENGADGDGVEFVYCRTTDDTPPSLYQSYVDIPNPTLLDQYYTQFQIRPGDPGYNTDANLIARWWKDSMTGYARIHNDYLPPSYQMNDMLQTIWTEEPQGVNDEYLYEWVAVRTYDGIEQDWGRFSDPVVWAKWGENGQNGVDGVNGIDGHDGEMWVLVPFKKDFSVRINNVNNYESIKGRINVDLAFGIAHIDGDTTTWLTAAELAGYTLNLITDNTVGQNVQTGITYNNQTITVNGTTIPVMTYSHNNYLEYTANTQTGNYIDYYYLHKNNLATRMPTRITVELVQTGIGKRNDYTQELIFNPDNLFSVTDNALNSVYQGLTGDTGGTFTTGFSNIRQEWDSIGLAVDNIDKYANGEYPVETNYEQFVYYCTNSSSIPTTPSGDISVDIQVYNQWTKYNMAPTQSYKYVWFSKRSRSVEIRGTAIYTAWSSWSPATLFQIYGSDRGFINGAALNITADQIQTTVASTYQTIAGMDDYVSQSELTQTANEITATVTTNIEGQLIETGIDITNGHITLNADNTTITGSNLTLEQDRAIVIKDSDAYNNIVIQANDIDTFGPNVTYYIGGTGTLISTDRHSFTSSSEQYEFHFAEFGLGRLTKNTKISLPYRINGTQNYNWQLGAYRADTNRNVTPSNAGTATVYYRLYKVGEVSPIREAYTTFNGVTLTGDLTYTVTSNSEELYITITVSYLTFDAPMNVDIYLAGNLQVKVEDAGNDSIIMGTNGYNVTSKYTVDVYRGSTLETFPGSFTEYLKNNEWRVEDTVYADALQTGPYRTGIRIQQGMNYPQQKTQYFWDYGKRDTWCTLGTIMHVQRTNSAVVNVTRDYDAYVFVGTGGTGQRVLNVQQSDTSAMPIGKIFYIKNLSSDSCKLRAGSAIIYDINSNGAVSELSIGTHSASFIYTGSEIIRLS